MPPEPQRWTTAALDAVRGALREQFPLCPPRLHESFVALLCADQAEVLARVTRVLEKPYGRNHLLEADGDHGISCAFLLPGRSTSLHWHGQRRELFAVRVGTLGVTLGPTRRSLTVGQHAASTPGIAHALANDGDEPAEVLELFSPYLLDDKTRVTDPYGRRTGQVLVDQ